MKLTEIENKLKETMKAKATAVANKQMQSTIDGLTARLNSLKLIKSELIKENQKVYERSEYKMTESEEILFLNGMAEKRKQNIKDYGDNGRPELAEAEQQELLILQEFLPNMPSNEELKEFIANKIDEYLSAQKEDYVLSMKDMGKIKPMVNSVYPTVNGGLIKEILIGRINGSK
jgi:uncharacterized protein YqeY